MASRYRPASHRYSRTKIIRGIAYTHQVIKSRDVYLLVDLSYMGDGTCYLSESGGQTSEDGISQAKKFSSLEDIRIWAANNPGKILDYSAVLKQPL